MPNGARIFLMNSEVFFTYTGWLQKHLAGWCRGLVEGLLLYQGLGVAILLQSLGNPLFLFSSAVGVERVIWPGGSGF